LFLSATQNFFFSRKFAQNRCKLAYTSLESKDKDRRQHVCVYDNTHTPTPPSTIIRALEAESTLIHVVTPIELGLLSDVVSVA
jgi:hypothetical protein